jgi:hypothetical protein
MKKLVAVLALSLGFASAAQASIMLEPYLGYEMGTIDNAPKGMATSTDKTTLTNIGARVGYLNFTGLWLALDLQRASGKYKSDIYADDNVTRTTIGADVGFDLPIFLRAWIGYGLSNEMKMSERDVKVTGTNVKMGVGFTFLPFICLNFEYIKEDWKKYDGDDLKVNQDKFNDTSYLVSVSLPLSF